jgi:hypothetical protein
MFSILQTKGPMRGASIGGMPNVPPKIVDGPINMAPFKKEKEKVVITNMN